MIINLIALNTRDSAANSVIQENKVGLLRIWVSEPVDGAGTNVSE